MRHYTSWVRFKNKLLKKKGKKQKTILKEYRNSRIDKDGEGLRVGLDKVCAILTQPAAELPEAEVVRMAWAKLPIWLQDDVNVYGRKSLKSLRQFRAKVEDILGDPVRIKLRELDRRTQSSNDDSGKGNNRNTGGYKNKNKGNDTDNEKGNTSKGKSDFKKTTE